MNLCRNLRLPVYGEGGYYNVMEILGVPLSPGEDIYMCLEHISKVISILFFKKDISLAHQLRLSSRKHAHPQIVVQFVSRMVWETWLATASHKEGINTAEISLSLTPGNEQLTPHNKALLGRASKFHFAGVVLDLPQLDRYDQRKAFGVVPHRLLLKKVDRVDIRGKALHWVLSFILNCKVMAIPYIGSIGCLRKFESSELPT
ncbi:hypothetical protein J6590_086966 [Homalodisca vitripennis]|nr:hypothetical protein J6590_086966 [Homalodisca vitripennis]